MMNATEALSFTRMKEFLARSPATIVVETSILVLIGLIAFGGILLVVISIYRNLRLRTITNYFVFALSMTDVLNPLLCLPFTIVWSIKSRFVFGRGACDFQAVASISLMQVSIATIVLMAFNRFIRVCKPQKYLHVFNKKKSLIMIGAVWLMYVVIVTVIVTSGKVLGANFKPNKIMCNLYRRNKTLLSKILFNLCVVIFIALPFAIIIYCYYKVFKKIREHKKSIVPSSNSNGDSLGTSVQEIKVTRILFAVLLGYCVTWFPVLIVVLVSSIIWLPRQAHMIFTYSMASSSAINPFIYGVMNTSFRREFVNILTCK